MSLLSYRRIIRIRNTPDYGRHIMAARRAPADPVPAPASPARLTPELPAGQAAAIVFSALADELEANLPGALANQDIEFLHDLRVAVRRTRAGIKAFGEIYRPEPLRPFAAEFRWLQQASGPARDLDVQVSGYADEIAQLTGDPGTALEPLRQLLMRKRRAAHTRLRRALRSARFRDLLREWREFLAAPAAGPDAETPIRKLADAQIGRAYRRVRKAGRRISPESPPEQLHELRKRGKELRYLLEFFVPLYPGKPMKRLVKELKSLQENLGAYQDHGVQAEHLRQWAGELSSGDADPDTLLWLGALMARHEEAGAAAREEFATRFAAFDAKENRRRFRDLFGA